MTDQVLMFMRMDHDKKLRITSIDDATYEDLTTARDQIATRITELDAQAEHYN